jgi:hypothetical protein
VARQDSWGSDNQPVQVRRHKSGGGATREAPARQERHLRGKRGDNATTNHWRERGAMRPRLHIPIFIPILGGQEPGAGFLFLLGFLRNPKETFLMFLLFLQVGTLVLLRNRNVFLLPWRGILLTYMRSI